MSTSTTSWGSSFAALTACAPSGGGFSEFGADRPRRRALHGATKTLKKYHSYGVVKRCGRPRVPAAFNYGVA